MTRINLVPPEELYDQHIIAEYREIRSLTRGLLRCFNGKKGIPKSRIPKKFTLNTGHVLFFFLTKASTSTIDITSFLPK